MCGKRVITKSQKVLGANSYVCRGYRGKIGRGDLIKVHGTLHKIAEKTFVQDTKLQIKFVGSLYKVTYQTNWCTMESFRLNLLGNSMNRLIQLI